MTLNGILAICLSTTICACTGEQDYGGSRESNAQQLISGSSETPINQKSRWSSLEIERRNANVGGEVRNVAVPQRSLLSALSGAFSVNKQFNPSRENLARTAFAMSRNMLQSGQFQEAAVWSERAYTLASELWGKRDTGSELKVSEYVDIALLHAIVLAKNRRCAEAIPVAMRCLDRLDNGKLVLGGDSIDISRLMLLQTLVTCKFTVGDFDDGNALASQLLTLVASVSEDDSIGRHGCMWSVHAMATLSFCALYDMSFGKQLAPVFGIVERKLSCCNFEADDELRSLRYMLARNHSKVLLSLDDKFGAYSLLKTIATEIRSCRSRIVNQDTRSQAVLLLLLHARVSSSMNERQEAIDVAYLALDFAIACKRVAGVLTLYEVLAVEELRQLLGYSIILRLGWSKRELYHGLKHAARVALREEFFDSQQYLLAIGSCAAFIDPTFAVYVFGIIVNRCDDSAYRSVHVMRDIKALALVGMGEAHAHAGKAGSARLAVKQALRTISEGGICDLDRGRVELGVVARCALVNSRIGNEEDARRISNQVIAIMCNGGMSVASRSGLDGQTVSWVLEGLGAFGLVESRAAIGSVDLNRIKNSQGHGQEGGRQALGRVTREDMLARLIAEARFRADCLNAIYQATVNVRLGEAHGTLHSAVRNVRIENGSDGKSKQSMKDGQSNVVIDLLSVSTASWAYRSHHEGPGHHYVAFLLLPDGVVRFVDLGDGEEIDRAVRKWRWEIQAGGDDAVTGKWLRERLWNPLEEMFPPDVARVYLCPDGELGLVPWGALPGKRSGSVLLDQFAFALVPHAGWFRNRSPENEQNDKSPAALPSSRFTLGAQQRTARDTVPVSSERAWGSDGASLKPLGITQTSPLRPRSASGNSALAKSPPYARWLIVGDVDYDAAFTSEDLPHEITDLQPDGMDHSPVKPVSVERPGGNKDLPRWLPLPHSRLELETLAGYLPPSLRTELTGRQATRTRVLEELPQVRWAHLATHGFHAGNDLRVPVGLENPQWLDADRRRQQILLRRQPLLLAGLVLAGGNQIQPPAHPGVRIEPSPILTGDDVAQLPLDQLELVVLSSCESGIGEVLVGEGVFGLQRAFHLAGAHNVVASLWQVDDEATAVLMKWFYFFLFEEQLPPMEALRQAQRTLRQQGTAATLLAQSRGPNFRQQARQLVRQSPEPSNSTTPTRLWAGFFLSGSGFASTELWRP